MIRFGIIGTNWITERFIQGAREHNEFVLKAVYSRTKERAKEFAQKHQIQLTFTNLEQMAKSDEIDAVYIASPNSLHASQAISFMKHGKHVLCEKPVASNTTELQEMIATAKKNNVLLMEALKTTYHPNFISIKKNLHKIGKVRRYFSSYCQYSSRYDAYKEGTILNAFKPEFSNGSLMDIGVYCIYPLVVLFGTPQGIKANGLMLESGVDGEGSVLFKYQDMDAVVFYSKITNSFLPSEIQGELGSILIDKISTPGKVEIRYLDGRIEDISQVTEHNSMYYEVEGFIDCIQNGLYESPINSFENSLNTTKILDDIRHQIGLVFPADHV